MFEFIRDNKRYFSILCIMFVMGIYFSQSSEIADNLNAYSILLFILIPLFVFAIYTCIKFIINVKFGPCFILEKIPILKITVFLIICILFLTIGCLRMNYAENLQNEKAAMFMDKSYFVKVAVVSDPKLNSKKTSVSFDGKLISYIENRKDINIEDMNVKIQIYSSYIGALKLNVGDITEFYCKFSIPNSADEYGDFDYKLYLRQKETAIVGSCKFLRLSEEPYKYRFKDRFLIFGATLRKSICNTIDENFGYSTEHSALMKSILTGDKSDMSESLREAMSKSGISHIAAVSGMHVSILFSAVSAILGIARFRKNIILIISIPILMIFMAVSSFSPSVMRAVIMLIIYITAYLIERDNDPITALFTAAFIMLFINPYTLFSVSFLLSFGSSLTILVFSPYIKDELCFISKIPLIGKFVADSFAISISSFLGTVYFSVYFFNYIALSGVLVNLWVIPLVPIIFCVGFLVWFANLLNLVSAVGFLRYLAVTPLEIIIRTAYCLKEIPILYPYMKLPSKFQFISYLLVLFFLFFLLKYRKENRNLKIEGS